MDIRDTDFWKNLAPIFSTQSSPSVSRTRGKPGAGVCDEGLMLDRFRQAILKAGRSHNGVLFMLVRLQAGEGAHLDAESMSYATELAMRRLARCLRSVDTLCHCTGGDLAILLEELKDSTPVPLVAEKIHSILEHPFLIDGEEMRLVPSSGAILYPADGNIADDLWTRARLSLAQACRESPGTCGFTPEVKNNVAMERLELIQQLHRAHRQREFSISYQPVFDSDSRQPTAVEALLRWQHPQRGELQPREFMYLLEDSGLIAAVGEQVLQRACRFFASLVSGQAGDSSLCVNVSARQFDDPGFKLAVLDALYDAGIAASRLRLECSLDELVKYRDLVTSSFEMFAESGVPLVIDQFRPIAGAQHLISGLPLFALKLDPSTLRERAVDISWLKELGDTRLSASGIESEQGLQRALELGCTELQGDYLCPPQNDRQFRQWISGDSTPE